MPHFSLYVQLLPVYPLFLPFPQNSQLFLKFFSPYAKIVHFFSILPNLSTFAPVMVQLSPYVRFYPFVKFCPAYAIVLIFATPLPNFSFLPIMPPVSRVAFVMPPKIAFTKLMPKLFTFLPLYAHDFQLYTKPLCKTPLPDLCQTFYFLPHLCRTFQLSSNRSYLLL